MKSILAPMAYKKYLLVGLVTLASLSSSLWFYQPGLQAATTIVVNSTADDQSNDGECTLREAIQAANTDNASGAAAGECAAGSGTDTINFSIAETADFTNNGQNGYTITPVSALPSITTTLTINGYSQAGAAPNTAIAPRPMNGTLLIEIDGTSAGGSTDGLVIVSSANNVTIRGLVINRFGFRGIGGNGGGSGTTVAGCYIGTDPTGLLDRGNADQGLQLGPNATIGGLNPADRNIIAGNDQGGASPNTGDNNWVIQGNYVGVGADGKTTISNSAVGGNGAFSLDNSDGHIIGGTATGATNVISGNRSFALFPDNADNLTIQGNIIGPDWEGKPLANNPQLGGIGLPPMAGPMNNYLIGGTSPQSSNLIAENNGPGIVVLRTVSGGGTQLANSTNISILGNRIYNNAMNSSFSLSAAGLGIDLASMNTGSFTLLGLGPTANDSGDSDSGTNNFINFPTIENITSSGDAVTIKYSLDINDSEVGATGYRVEFFANTIADASGFGEGQTYIGSDTVSGDVSNRSTTLTNTSLAAGSYAITATTTMADNSADGFGPTSEFSQAVNGTITSATLADTGQSVGSYRAIAYLALTVPLVGLAIYRLLQRN